MEKNPTSSGMPASASVPIPKVIAVQGIFRQRPPSRFTSITPSVACITLPAPRNRTALKKAWATRWKIATE